MTAETADRKHREIAAATGRNPSLQRDDETFDEYQRRMNHGLYSEGVINETGREFGSFIVEGPGRASKKGRLWNVRCLECGDATVMRGSQIRRHSNGKRPPMRCKKCVTSVSKAQTLAVL